jgi:hypothetical protein
MDLEMLNLKTHFDKLHNLYCSHNIIHVMKSRRMGWVGHVACTSNIINSYRISVRQPQGRRLHGRLWHRWQHNIKMDLREIYCVYVDWIELAQDSCANQAEAVNTVMNLDQFSDSGFKDALFQ